MNRERIIEIATGVLDQFGLDLDDVEIKPAGRHTLLRIVIDGDGPDGLGPGLDDITEATQTLTSALDSSDAAGSQGYTLEVSSRGTDRPLTLPRHWRRNRDRLVRVKLAGGDALIGRIIRSDESSATVETERGDRQVLAFSAVADARIQIEMNRKPAQIDLPDGSPESADGPGLVVGTEPDDRSGPTEGHASNGQSEREH